MADDGSTLIPRSYGGLEALQKEFLAYQRAVFPDREPRFFALELCGEAGELANLEKKKNGRGPPPRGPIMPMRRLMC